MWLYGHRRTHMESMYMWPGMGTDNETMNLIYDYTDILDGLTDICWREIDRTTQAELRTGFITRDFPRIFARWFLEWEEIFPSEFPLPLPMRYFGPIRINFQRFVFNSSGDESELSKTIGRAWTNMPDPSRQLMLFYWCGLNSIREQQMANLNLNKSSAKLMLQQEFHGTHENLQAAAFDIVDYLFSD